MLVGVFGAKTENSYVKIYSGFNYLKDKKPKEVKTIVVDESAIIKDLFLILDNNYYYEVKLVLKDKVFTLENDKLLSLLTEENIYLPIKDSKTIKNNAIL